MGTMTRCSIAALVSGAIAAAVWSGITYATGMEIGWIAWGVGLVVGIAVRMAAGGTDGVGPGTIAVIGAVLALIAGKYAAVHLMVRHELGDVVSSEAMNYTAEDMKVSLADDIVGEWEEAGKKVVWPTGKSLEDASSQADYPPDVWAAAVARWDAMKPAEQEAQIQERKDAMAMVSGMLQDEITEQGFKSSFSPIDLLFFGLAVVTSFKVGSGMSAE